MKPVRFALLLTAAALVTAGPALADTASYSLTTTNPILPGGSTVTFDGTISAPASNTGAIFLLGDTFNIGAPLVLDDADFGNDTPFFLNPGMSYSGPLFTVSLPNSTPEGIYAGIFTVDLADSNNNAIMESANFQVTATPEPGSWLLLATGLAGAVALRRKLGFARA